MDLRTLNRIKGVAKVTGVPASLNVATLFYFLCPCLSSKGIMVNNDETGFTARYVDRLSGFVKARLLKVRPFQTNVNQEGWDCKLQPIWGSADALILYSYLPPIEPPLPPAHEGLDHMIANHVAVKAHMQDFWAMYKQQPWKACPSWVQKQEEKRLLSLLPTDAPKSLCQDFVSRVFAGFALDGLLLRKGVFGFNPVILGVESPGVPILQNAALKQSERIPVIQLE